MERFLFIRDELPIAYAIISDDKLSLYVDKNLDKAVKDELMDRVVGLEYPITEVAETSSELKKISLKWERSSTIYYEEIEI